MPKTPDASFPTSIDPKSVKLMQESVTNSQSGGFFMLKTAYDLKHGNAAAETVLGGDNTIRMWENLAPEASGPWTVDHRRLVAAKLAGLENIPVRPVDPVEAVSYRGTTANPTEFGQAQQYGHAFKMSTTSGGTDIEINVNLKDGKFTSLSSGSDPLVIQETWRIDELPNGEFKIFRQPAGQTEYVEVPFESLPNFWN